MATVNSQDFRSPTPKLGPDDLEGDAAILTVESFEQVDVEDDEAPNGKRKAALLAFKETGDRVLWLNGGMVEALIEQLGAESDLWIGAKVPVEKYVARFRGKAFPKVRVLPSEEWAVAFKEAGVKFTGRKAPAPVPVASKKRGR